MSSAADQKSSTPKQRLLVVGGGLTGCVTAHLLTQAGGYQIDIWDKSRGLGGRMSTRRYPETKSQVDLGAQYITATPEYQKTHASFYESLLKAEVLSPLQSSIAGMRSSPQGTLNYVTPRGISTVVKHFFNSSSASLSRGRRVSRMDRNSEGVLVTATDGYAEVFDKVVITAPVPQILEMKGNVVSGLSAEHRRGLSQVSYSSRYALALFYEAGTDLKLPFVAKYVRNSDIVFISVDQQKRGVGGEGTALMVHTSVPFGLAHIDEDKRGIPDLIVPALKREIPNLPDPVHTHVQKWRYSQVYKGYPNSGGALELTPGVIAAGDAFTHSNMDGCISSALAAVRLLSP